MRTHVVALDEAERATGTVVVIDVLRAFTTAAIAFEAGASAIVLMRDEEAARLAARDDPGALAMGEVNGSKPGGFDLSNSPEEVGAAQLEGRTVYHRTTAGTRGAVQAGAADALVVASFVCAGATARWISSQRPDALTFVITGAHDDLDGDEDLALSDYLTAQLAGHEPDPAYYLDRVRRSDAGRRFTAAHQPQYRPRDLEIACEVDRVDFAMPVGWEDGRPVVRPVRGGG